jgi:diguanylate cyclase (GGDEF)-like protein/PAS domain S-box-containing protein
MVVFLASRDEAGDISGFRCEICGPGAPELLGRTRTGTVGRDLTAIWPGLEDPGAHAALVGVVDRGMPCELEVAGEDGRRLLLGAVGVGDLLVATVSDVTAQRRAEEARRDGEERLRAAMAASIDAFWIAELADGAPPGEPDLRVVDANRAMEELAGAPEGGLTDRPVRDVLEPGQAAELLEAARRVLAEGRPVRRDLEVPRGRGTTRWTEQLIVRVDARRVAVSERDVTARVEAEALLRRQLDWKATLIDAIQEGFIAFDASLTVTEVNQRLCEMTGFTRDELVGGGAPLPFWPAEDAPEWRRRLADVTRSGTSEFEVTMRDRDDRRVPVAVSGAALRDDRGRVVGVIATVKDMSRWREREEELRRSREAYAALAENAPDLILGYDADLRLVYVNRAVEVLTGRPRDQLLGRTVRELGMPDDLADLWERQMRTVLRTGRPAELAFQYPSRTGVRWFDSRLAPETGADGRPQRVLVVTRDITERRRLDERVRASESAQRALATREAALLRVAEQVARGAEPGVVCGVAAEQAARLLGADAAWVVVLEGPSDGREIGGWSRPGVSRGEVPLTVLLRGDGALGRAARTGRPARIEDYGAETDAACRAMAAQGFRSGIAAPIVAGGRMWGLLLVARTAPAVGEGAEDLLGRFADLVSVALANAQADADLRRLALTDPLTGLLNRRAFLDRLEQALHLADRHGGPLSLAILDLDHFKEVNDRHGHEAGDRVLSELAVRLTSAARREEVLGRLGGEEFAWLFPRSHGDAAVTAVERVRASVGERPMGVAGHVRFSAGVAEWRPGEPMSDLMRRADRALYRAKAAGRNCVEHDDPGGVQEAGGS